MSFLIEPIGTVRGGREEIADDHWGDVCSTIELVGDFAADALASLADFSHAEIVFIFDRVADAKIERGARRPRGRADWPLVGIFAQRGKNRPNRIGSTVVQIVSVEGTKVSVKGLDAIDGTPVVDIKPILKGFLPRGEIREPAWASEIMAEYWE